MANSTPKIAIVGAGPAGLTLARLLVVSEANVDITLYERDKSRASRPDQGGCLDLHTDTGLAAIRKCGLWDEFEKYARYDGEEMIIADKNATELVHMRSKGGGSPEIDRGSLKQILLDGVPERYVRWDRRLKRVREDGMLEFEDQKELEGPFDLVVGADGATSKVRERLSSVKPSYSGVSGYEFDIKEPARTCPDLNKMVGRGGFLGTSDRKFLNTQRMGNDSLKVRSWFVCPEELTLEEVDKYGDEGIIEKILSRYEGWAPEMTNFLRQADPNSLRRWVTYELPLDFTWDHKSGYTLLGDAASLAPPFSGEGVNKAMVDAMELAQLLQRSLDIYDDLTWDEAVQQYETQQYPRAHKLMETTRYFVQSSFFGTAPIGLMTGLLKRKTGESSSVFIRALGTAPFVALLFTYFWIRQQIGWGIRKLWRRN
ncbi:salicylate hydroxylase [Lophiostoma macrostomum CBS 122681]|uniref:Salicylate hydroxylase n=1 Tax=Lophiostoma macrostomum CBS 122681 TaxID=1314788 RepID=A0A6A6TB56_9PLEO|nr:salicylate hydroxylase [Lophiostoma macrostomum CBS 122681]